MCVAVCVFPFVCVYGACMRGRRRCGSGPCSPWPNLFVHVRSVEINSSPLSTQAMLAIQVKKTVYSMQLSKVIDHPCGKEIAQGGGGFCVTQVEG